MDVAEAHEEALVFAHVVHRFVRLRASEQADVLDLAETVRSRLADPSERHESLLVMVGLLYPEIDGA